jgi:hypothetical protein
VQPAVAEAEVGRGVCERKPIHVALEQLDVRSEMTRRTATGAGEHRRLDVDTDPAHALAGTEPAEGDPTAARNVEHGRAVGQLADRSEAAIERARIDPPHRPEDEPRQKGAFDVEVVDGPERPCAYVPLLCHRAHSNGTVIKPGL